MTATPSQALRAAAVAALLCVLSPAAFADIYVIVNPRLTLNAEDIKGIYTGEKQLAGSIKITPLDNSSAKMEFLSKVLQLDPVKYDALWIKKSFRDGINPPIVKATDEEVIAIVRSTAGTIGYVSSAPPDGVVVLKKF